RAPVPRNPLCPPTAQRRCGGQRPATDRSALRTGPTRPVLRPMEHHDPGEPDPPSRPRTSYEQAVRALGARLLAAQRPIRILEAVHWDAAVEEAFLSRGGREPPPVTPDYYTNRPL